ncbi:SGNH/GDSL hydrolase family protein [Roseibium sp. Sym1]|uniref:SGNH/GDSL hydrolase family protein n=1 Tax=Roseibium sp. Sym1 TaxID=3016006 RepID=UPI0022B3D434|nr:GDSL-type esterase/lipase family protein [Roseibium sp. Sym1]
MRFWKWHDKCSVGTGPVLRLVALAVALAFVLEPAGAAAQAIPDEEIVVAQNGPFRGFNPFAPLQRLFGGGQRRTKKQPQRQQRPRATRPAGAAPKFETVQKDPDAGLILVVGDRMARGVADGLKFMLSEKPQIRVEPITDDKGGFTGETPPDWTTQVLSKIRGGDVKAVVVMIGHRDLGKTFPGEPPIEFMTQEWLDTYRDKVAALVRVVRQEKKPLVWAGLPPTNDELVNADFTQLNSIFQGSAEDRRVRYVDIWDIFLAEDSTYSSYGPDVDGKNTRLRTNDRIGFTWAGYQKVAFFVERELLRLLGGYGGLAFEGVEDDPNFIVLTGRTTSPEALLLGGEEDTSIDPKSRPYRFFVNGEPLQPMRGRVDDPRVRAEGPAIPLDEPASTAAPPRVPGLRGPLSGISRSEQGSRVSVTLQPGGE